MIICIGIHKNYELQEKIQANDKDKCQNFVCSLKTGN